ncbi:hypothetical protein Bca4012_090668 [Brassica carinata]
MLHPQVPSRYQSYPSLIIWIPSQKNHIMRSYLSCRFLFKHRNGFPTKLVRKLPHKTYHHEFLVLTSKPSRRNRAKQHLQEHEFQFFRNEEKTGSDVETNRSSSTNTCKRTLQENNGERRRHRLDIYGGTRSDKGK